MTLSINETGTRTKAPTTPGLRRIRGGLAGAMCAGVLLVCSSAWAQPTVNWNNAGTGDWNTPGNWDSGIVPGVATNASILTGVNVTYGSPMVAPSFLSLNLGSPVVLDISASGFNIDGTDPSSGNSFNFVPLTVNAGAALNVNAAGVLFATNAGTVNLSGTNNIGGTAVLSTCGTNATPPAAMSINTGGVLNVTNGLFETTNSGPLLISGTLNVNGGNVLLLANAGNSLAALAGSTLNIANGSVTGNRAMLIVGAATKLTVGANGTLSVTNGNLSIGTNAAVTILPGGTISALGTLNVGQGGNSSSGGGQGFVTNNGGIINVGGLTINNPGSANQSCLCQINGGTNDLGAVNIYRSSQGSLGTPGVEGLIINNGLVRMTNLNVGNGPANSYLTMYVANGILTNTGNFFVGQITSGRGARFVQSGGLMVNSGTAPIQLGQTNNGNIAVFGITGGTNFVPGFIVGGALTNGSTAGTVNFTNAGTMVIGASGIVSNWLPTLNFRLNDGGSFYSGADWTGGVPMTLNGGTFSIFAADFSGTAHNVTLTNRISGSGIFNKGGLGTLTLNFSNSYTASTMINAGTLAIGANGAISSSTLIQVASGAIYDVTASAAGSGGGTNLANGQKLAGTGTVQGPINAVSGSAIQPAGNLVPGTLTFANALGETGNVINNFDLSSDPTGTIKTNDLIVVQGDLNLSGTNTIQINALDGTILAGSVYPLIHYSGALNGDVTTNFAVSPAGLGIVSNNASSKVVSLVVQSTIRLPANVTWVGNALNNNWNNSLSTTNWLNGAALSAFVTGDRVRFDANGQANPLVNVVGSVNPSNTVVDASTGYSFIGSGSVDGFGGLTKTNSGTLTISTTNNYVGPTVIGGGVVEVTRLAASGTASGIGAANTDPSNLVFFASTLRYLSANNASSDRGMTFNGLGGTVEVTSATNTLTMSGNTTGPGGLTKTGPGTLVLGGTASYVGATMISNGTLQLTPNINGIGTNEIDFAGGNFNMSTGLGSQPQFTNNLNVLSPGGTLTVNGANVVSHGSWAGTGTFNIVVATNGIFTIDHAIDTNFSGTFSMGTSSGPFRFNAGGSSTTNQQCTGSTNVVFDLGTGTAMLVNRNGGGPIFGVYYLGALIGGPGTTVLGSTNTGTTSSYVIGDKGLDTTFAGTFINGFSSSTATNPQASANVSVVKSGSSKLTLTGTNIHTGSTTISGGVLALSGGGAITRSTNIDINAGMVLDVSGRTDGTLTLNANQILSGDGGIVRGSVTVRSGGGLSPGENPTVYPPGSGVFGVATITNSLVLQSGSTVYVDADPNGGTNDVIKAASVTFGGTLNVHAISGYAITNTFKIFNANSYSGGFSSILPVAPGNIYSWDTSTLAVDGTLRLKPTEPQITSVGFFNGFLQLGGSYGPPNASYDVLVSTNLTTPTSQWTLQQSSVFNGDGTFSLAIPYDPVSQPDLFVRLRYSFSGN
jgi:autotransporter-associated beta strand protein